MYGTSKTIVHSAAVGVFVWAFGLGVAQAQTGHEGHGSMSQQATGLTAVSSATVPRGVVIREARVQGYALTYRLYSWDERNAMMKGMEGHSMPGMDTTGASTNHLMVFIKGADGKDLTGGKVGFVVTDPGKSEFKTLTMGMFDGFGADVPLKTKGVHTIKLKAVLGNATVNDEFPYSVNQPRARGGISTAEEAGFHAGCMAWQRPSIA